MRKNRARTKSWLCFQPNFSVSDEQPIDSDFKPHQSIDPVYISLKPQPEIMPIPILPKVPSKLKIPSDKEIVTRTRKRSSRRSLSRILKAVFFESSLRKSKKVQQDPSHTLKNHPHDFKSNKKTKQEELKPKENISSFISSSPSSPSLSSLSAQKKQLRTKSLERRTFENEPSRHSKTKRECNGVSSINGLYLLLITLLVLVFWGRICAIICTSTWIYFGPFLRKNDEEVIKAIKVEEEEPPKMESREYKKRVIMEGLLERNHGRF